MDAGSTVVDAAPDELSIYLNTPPAERQAPIFVGPDAEIKQGAYSEELMDRTAQMESYTAMLKAALSAVESGQAEPGALDGAMDGMPNFQDWMKQMFEQTSAFAQSPEGLSFVERSPAAAGAWQAEAGSLDDAIRFLRRG